MLMGNRKRRNKGVERCEIIEGEMNEWVYRIGAVVVTQTLKWRQWTTRTYILVIYKQLVYLHLSDFF